VGPGPTFCPVDDEHGRLRTPVVREPAPHVKVTTADLTSGLDPKTPATYAVTDEYGQVQPSGQFSVSGNGTYSFTVLLEARRDGQDRDGRRYTITIKDRDLAGHWGSNVIEVLVPHDRRDYGRSAVAGRWRVE
jgi:hypothetical protein